MNNTNEQGYNYSPLTQQPYQDQPLNQNPQNMMGFVQMANMQNQTRPNAQYQTNQQHPFNNQNQNRGSGFFQMGSGFDEPEKSLKNLTANSRMGFIRKVYLILATQLFVTFLFILLAFLSDNFRRFQRENMWLFYVCIPIVIITLYALACYRRIARKVPLNYILLGLFTLAESYMIAMIASQYDYTIVLFAGALTLAVVVGLTIYAFTTKRDFTGCTAFLFVLVLVLIVAGILAAIFRSRWLQWLYCILGTLIFGVYLIVDTQLVVGKNKNMFSIDDYIMAAMTLYIDIIQLFLFILQILGMASDQIIKNLNFDFINQTQCLLDNNLNEKQIIFIFNFYQTQCQSVNNLNEKYFICIFNFLLNFYFLITSTKNIYYSWYIFIMYQNNEIWF